MLHHNQWGHVTANRRYLCCNFCDMQPRSQVPGGDHQGCRRPGKALVSAGTGTLSPAAPPHRFSWWWLRPSASASASAAATLVAGRERHQRRPRFPAQLRPGLAAERALKAQQLPGECNRYQMLSKGPDRCACLYSQPLPTACLMEPCAMSGLFMHLVGVLSFVC